MEAIGIFIGLVGLIWDCSDRCKNNAATFENLERDYRSLTTLLRQVENELPDSSNSDPIREGCRQIAADIEKILRKHAKGSKRNANPWKLFKRTLEDVDSLRSRLICQVVMLHTSSALSSPRGVPFDMEHETVSTTVRQVPFAVRNDEQICDEIYDALRVSKHSEDLKKAVRNSVLGRPVDYTHCFNHAPNILTSPNPGKPPDDTHSLAEVSSCGSSFSMLSSSSSDSFERKQQRSRFTSKKSRFFKAAVKADTLTLMELQALVDKETVQKALLGVTQAKPPLPAHVDVMRLLLSFGADAECSDSSYRRTPLIWAILSNHVYLFRALLEAGAKLETRDGRRHNTPLIWAIYADNPAITRHLIGQKAQMNIADNITGHAPLLLAAHLGHLEAARAILEEDRRLILSKDANEYTPLAIAYLNRHLTMAELYVDYGDDVNFLWPSGSRLSLLSMAIIEGQAEFARLFVDKGARVTTINDFPPLTVAVRQQSIPMVEIVLKALSHDTTALENRDVKRGTALLWAIWLKNERVVELLVAAGADVSTKDGDGVSAQCWARWTGRPKIIALVA